MIYQTTFCHDYSRVEDYLHHRAPWLMVDTILAIHDDFIQTSKTLTGNEPFFAGHFPEAPIVPGSMLQEMTTQSAGILLAARFNPMPEFDTHDPKSNEYALGVLVRVNHSRFRGFIRPADSPHIEVELTDRVGNIFEFRGQVRLDRAIVMSNRFQLANIPSSTLIGSN